MATKKGTRKKPTSMKKMANPKVPKLDGTQKQWDDYEKKKKEVDAHNKLVDAEKERRKKIKEK